MLNDIDHGIRCDRHQGEVFPPRCAQCDLAASEAAELAALRHTRGECPKHAGYPIDRFGCARCMREEMPS